MSVEEFVKNPAVQEILKQIEDGTLRLGTGLPEGFHWTEEKKRELDEVLKKYAPKTVD